MWPPACTPSAVVSASDEDIDSMFQFNETEDSTIDRRASIALNESVQGQQKHRATKEDAESAQEKRKKYFHTHNTGVFFLLMVGFSRDQIGFLL
jgi:hypothetical protein